MCVWRRGWGVERRAWVCLLMQSPDRPRGTARGAGSSPTHPHPSGGLFQGVKKVAATPGNMAKFALNQNLPGKCGKWCLRVYRSTPGAQVPTQPCSSLLCRVVRGPFIKVDNVLALLKICLWCPITGGIKPQLLAVAQKVPHSLAQAHLF